MPRLQHKPVTSPDEVRPYELGQNELFDMDDFVVGRMVHNPGWHWRTQPWRAPKPTWHRRLPSMPG